MLWSKVTFLFILTSKVHIFPASPLPQNNYYYDSHNTEKPVGICALSGELDYHGENLSKNAVIVSN